VALCITEVVSWGVLYYAFPVALSAITADTGWSPGAASAAFSAGLVVSAVVGIGAGRVLDARRPRLVMTAGSVLAVPAVAGIAMAPNLAWFTAAWVLAGFAMAATFYPPAFAALTRWYGDQRMKALTALTLVAGLSSTVFAPLTALLLQHLSWRGTYLVLGLVLAAVTIPLHAFALRPRWETPQPTASMTETASRSKVVQASVTTVGAVVRSRSFLLLCAAFTVLALGFYVASLGAIPLLTERGLSHELAATTLGLLGAGQLAGRLAYAPLQRRTSSSTQLLLVIAATTVVIAALAVASPSPVVLIAVAVLLGALRGMFTLMQAAIVAERWGTAAYGALAAPITAATAIAPWASAALAGAFGSYTDAFLVLAALTAIAAVCSGLDRWLKPGDRPRH